MHIDGLQSGCKLLNNSEYYRKTAASASVIDDGESIDHNPADELILASLLESGDSKGREDTGTAIAKYRDLWSQHRLLTEAHSIRLSEQLRLILEPTLATRLTGDYRTGKRINMRKVIGYIASGFRKDKIWLRRTKPAKRDYQVMVMIDDSSSMGEAGPLALSALALISNALTRLEVGDISVTAFAEDVRVLHPFGGEPFTDEVGAKVISQFTFEAKRTLLASALTAVLPYFEHSQISKSFGKGGGGGADAGKIHLQLCFVISDARIDTDNRQDLTALIKRMTESNVLVVLLIIDKNENVKDSIFSTKTITFTPNGGIVTKSYFDDFPFPYYAAVQRVDGLPEVLSDALKQWFEMIRIQLDGN
jgi:midasin (ATPase involved in ribosome maturation)